VDGEETMIQTLTEVIKRGGPFMVMNIICLAVVVALIIERAIYFLGRGHINSKAFLEQIKRLLAAGNLDRARKLCEATTAPVARVAKAGLSRVNKGEAAVAQAIEETMIDVTPEIKVRIAPLWSLANIATLLGLLGTVSALISIFKAVAYAKPQDKQTLLSGGIAEAMYNTAIGLFIAVVCMVAHLILAAAAKRTIGELESFALRLENMLGDSGGSTGEHPTVGR
jgi:biopolymer transport protein ExbB